MQSYGYNHNVLLLTIVCFLAELQNALQVVKSDILHLDKSNKIQPRTISPKSASALRLDFLRPLLRIIQKSHFKVN